MSPRAMSFAFCPTVSFASYRVWFGLSNNPKGDLPPVVYFANEKRNVCLWEVMDANH